MARTLLLAATIVWLAAGAVGVGIGMLGAGNLQRVLPSTVVIDAAALGGAVVAVAIGVLAVGIVHGVVVLGMRAGYRLALSAALLLAATMSALLLALATTSATSAVTVPDRAASFLFAAGAALAGAVAYGVVTALLVAEVRTGRPD
jgi:hypothetical protein